MVAGTLRVPSVFRNIRRIQPRHTGCACYVAPQKNQTLLGPENNAGSAKLNCLTNGVRHVSNVYICSAKA